MADRDVFEGVSTSGKVIGGGGVSAGSIWLSSSRCGISARSASFLAKDLPSNKSLACSGLKVAKDLS